LNQKKKFKSFTQKKEEKGFWQIIRCMFHAYLDCSLVGKPLFFRAQDVRIRATIFYLITLNDFSFNFIRIIHPLEDLAKIGYSRDMKVKTFNHLKKNWLHTGSL
jgi:hypothetical protein